MNSYLFYLFNIFSFKPVLKDVKDLQWDFMGFVAFCPRTGLVRGVFITDPWVDQVLSEQLLLTSFSTLQPSLGAHCSSPPSIFTSLGPGDYQQEFGHNP